MLKLPEIPNPMHDQTATIQTIQDQGVQGSYVHLDGELYYRILNIHLMPEFFMSVVGADDHWMFLSSRGALTAGRRNPDGAIFPYAADDQISAMRGQTGPVTLIRIGQDSPIWVPFSEEPERCGAVERALYKSPMGNKVVFEERHATGLVFRYRWTFSPQFGFIRDCRLQNAGSTRVSLAVLDGVQNILPCGVGSDFWMRYSNLGNAYKKSEKVSGQDLGIFYLSSIPSDRAEPSEGLRATTVWHAGFAPDAVMLSTEQIGRFYCGAALETERSVRGKPGAFLVTTKASLEPGEALTWRQVLDLGKDQTDVANLQAWLEDENEAIQKVDVDVQQGEHALRRLIASSDGLQCGRNLNRVHRHFSNTLFNVMRGGVPLRNYMVGAGDFRRHMIGFNSETWERNKSMLEGMPEHVSHVELNERLHRQGDPDLTRLGLEYLPLAFSRRHGDPTRPWNRFSIDLRSADGKSNLNYQGNWRDIFQNWEAMGLSFPAFFPAMICRFVNATTADGYNAYRLTKDGLEWEEPSPEDPWSNIGYWSDHQIIYLLKLLEWNSRFHPSSSRGLLSEKVFVHAEVPYRIRDFQQIRKDPRNTIDFDWGLAQDIEERVERLGADGKLLRNRDQHIHHVTLVEKLLTLSLAKLSNFVPDGGVWLNTQRPEWNDANNALVGNGLSMVTTCYLHRWFAFLEEWIGSDEAQHYTVSSEVAGFWQAVNDILAGSRVAVREGFSPTTRSRMVTALSRAGSDFRTSLYSFSPTGETVSVGHEEMCAFFRQSRELMEATIRSNRREDGLFHSYNLLDWQEDQLEVETLQVMLEGQVAVLSSGLLTAREAIELLDALSESALYREDQASYLLYPDRELPSFLNKNRIPEDRVAQSPLLQALLTAGDTRIIKRDVRGSIHFNGDFRNASELLSAMQRLESPYQAMVEECGHDVSVLFEEVFKHRKFTGRSGTFFAYEGLGSIYWHMVSKLGLAVAENIQSATEAGESGEVISQLKSHLEAIRTGIGAEKAPQQYGAFPTDPYSHTPEKAGVKQPGMTGQVKEDVISRFMELGVQINNGRIAFRLDNFDHQECLASPETFTFFDVQGQPERITVPKGGFGYTVCQTPVIYGPGKEDHMTLHMQDGSTLDVPGHELDTETSASVFKRTGAVKRIECMWRDLV